MVNMADTGYRVFQPNLGEGTQAARIFARFGGVSHLVKALNEAGFPATRSGVYRWNHPKDRGGTGGVIPTKMWAGVMAAARLYGIQLGAEELDPRSN